jgi:hypothetical protein
MTAFDSIPPLKTPEEVAEMLGGHISPFTIRRLVAQGACSHTAGARKKILFSGDDVLSLLAALKAPAAPAPEAEEEEDVFQTTGRSSARNRKAS